MKPNVICAWCNTPMHYDARIAEHKFSHGMCKTCEESFNVSLTQLEEDWKFQPQPGGDTVTLDPHYGMSNLKKVDKEDDAMPEYKYTEDPGVKTTQDMLDKYQQLNAKNNAMRNIPMGV